MKKPNITIRGIPHSTAREAINHRSGLGDDKAVSVSGMFLTISTSEAERLEASGIPFAYLHEVNNQLITVPVG